MFSNFQLSQPPYFELPPGAEFTGHEPALLVLVRGQKLNGSLSRFMRSHGVAEFLPSRGRFLVASIVKIARTLDIGIFAQAVEDEALVPLLLELGFSGYQGNTEKLPLRIV